MDALVSQLYELSKGIKLGEYSIPDLGQIVPASLMLHDLEHLQPIKCIYMNSWGTNFLGSYPEEIVEMGPLYYDNFFVKEEIYSSVEGLISYLLQGDHDNSYNFFQRVKNYASQSYVWCFTTCKILEINSRQQLVILSTPIVGMDYLIQRVNKTLDLTDYIKENYKRFALLTKREKEIIIMLTQGSSTTEISDKLFISSHTVATHRKNISKKIECKSFAELLKFASHFDLT